MEKYIRIQGIRLYLDFTNQARYPSASNVCSTNMSTLFVCSSALKFTAELNESYHLWHYE